MNARVTPAVGAVIFRENKVLLIQRGKPPFYKHWSIPGGKIEHGEAMEDALAREVFEETGVRFTPLGLIGAFEALPEKPDDPHFVMIDYAGAWVSGEPVAGDDAMDAMFLPIPEALARLAWDKTRLAIQNALPYMHKARSGAGD